MKRLVWFLLSAALLVGVNPNHDRSMRTEGDVQIGSHAPQVSSVNGAPLPEVAWFAMGCFWGPDGAFGVIPGVLRTRAGYAGGTGDHPTYYELGGAAETVEVIYDPSLVQYEVLLEVFWKNHSPYGLAYSGQYRSVIFVGSEAQRSAAKASLERQAEAAGRRPTTEIVDLEQFTPAEDHHQKFRLQSDALLFGEIRDRFATFDEFVASAVAARVNGYLGGWGDSEDLERLLPSLGLSADGVERLRAAVRQSPVLECSVPGLQ
jgi:methionine-S-sulfoxide reductase